MSAELPGQYPFTRGIYPEMYRSRLWTMRQYAGFGSAEESNRRYKYLLSQGITGLSVAFDLPTQMGMDSDHPLAAGEVGRVGVAICSLADMERLFEGIRATADLHLDDDQFDGVDSACLLHAGGAEAGRRSHGRSSARFRTTFLRNTSRAGRTSILRVRRCGSLPICSHGPAGKCPSGTRFRLADITSAKRARPRCRKLPLLWRMPSRISRRRSMRVIDRFVCSAALVLLQLA